MRSPAGSASTLRSARGPSDLHLSDLPLKLQEYMEDYIQQFIPRNRVVHHWFDVYDLEEERI